MKIALIGATGFVGTAVLEELLQRQHQVTALVRNVAKLGPASRLSVVAVDAFDSDALASAVHGHDAVVSAFNPGWNEPDLYDKFLRGSRAIERGVEASGVKRLLVVGGAGSLFVAPGVQLVDTPEFSSHVPANVVLALLVPTWSKPPSIVTAGIPYPRALSAKTRTADCSGTGVESAV